MKSHAFVLALFAFVVPRVAEPCQYGSLPEPAAALASADAVFTGTVVDVTDSWGLLRKLTDRVAPPDYGKLDHDDYYERYGFRVIIAVSDVWKGAIGKRIAVETGRATGDCGVPFSKGSSYLLYTYRNKLGNHTASICTRTTERSRAAADLLVLGTPRVRP